MNVVGSQLLGNDSAISQSSKRVQRLFFASMSWRDAVVTIMVCLINKVGPCAFYPKLRSLHRSGIVGESAVADRPEDSPYIGMAVRFDK